MFNVIVLTFRPVLYLKTRELVPLWSLRPLKAGLQRILLMQNRF